MDTNILDLLERSAETKPQKPAYVSPTDQLTWGELADIARHIGAFFAAALVPDDALVPGRAVVVLMDHNVYEVPALYGVVYAGCFSIPLDPSMPADRVKKILDAAQPAYLLYDQVGQPLLEALRELGELSFPTVRYEDALLAPVDQDKLELIRYNSSAVDPIEVFYTSGSTGVPKGVVHTHRSMLYYADRVLGWTKYVNENQVWGNQAPFFYSNAIFDLFPPLVLGATVYLIPQECYLFPQLFLNFFREKRITNVLMTPLNYLYIADSGALKPGCLSDLIGVYMCGEAVPYRQMRMWADAAAPGAGVFNFYGSTECPYCTTLELGDRVMEPGDIVPSGYPLRGVKLLILNENGQEVPRGQTGEMFITAPWISSGYYRDPERTAAAFVNDPLDYGYDQLYYRTGDLGWMDEEWNLHVLGRKDSQIKHRGYRMDLGEVEAALRALPGWQNGCCLHNPADDKLCCFWSGPLTQADLQRLLPEKLEKYMLPNRYIHLEELPRTSSGKLDRMALRREYLSEA